MTIVAAASAPRVGETSKARRLDDFDNSSIMEADAAAATLKVDIEKGLSSQEAAHRKQ